MSSAENNSIPHATCTVVIPCFDAEPYLEAAVASVRAQRFRDYHIVVVDDASQDRTRELARRLAGGQSDMTVIELPENCGRSHARNRGSQATTGPYVTFLDQDDTHHPDFLSETINALNQFHGFDAIKALPNINADIDQVRYEAIANSLATTTIFRRPAFEFIGGWPECEVFRQHPGGCEDIALLQLFGICFNLGVLHAKFYNYTLRPGNALDQFLKRSSVIDGNLHVSGRTEIDSLMEKENERLRMLLRNRIRRNLIDRKQELLPLDRDPAIQ